MTKSCIINVRFMLHPILWLIIFFFWRIRQSQSTLSLLLLLLSWVQHLLLHWGLDTSLRIYYYFFIFDIIALILEIVTAMNLVNETNLDFDCLSTLKPLEKNIGSTTTDSGVFVLLIQMLLSPVSKPGEDCGSTTTHFGVVVLLIQMLLSPISKQGEFWFNYPLWSCPIHFWFGISKSTQWTRRIWFWFWKKPRLSYDVVRLGDTTNKRVWCTVLWARKAFHKAE